MFDDYRFRITQKPTDLPASLEIAKTQHARVDSDYEDSLMQIIAEACVDYIEAYTGKKLITQTAEAKISRFPSRRSPLYLPYSPAQSVTSISYIDENGNNQTWDSANYEVDTTGVYGFVQPAFDTDYPDDIDTSQDYPITITYVVGYGDDAGDVPAAAKLGMYQLFTTFYDNRAEISKGINIMEIPMQVSVLRLLDSLKVVKI